MLCDSLGESHLRLGEGVQLVRAVDLHVGNILPGEGDVEVGEAEVVGCCHGLWPAGNGCSRGAVGTK